MFGFNKNKNDKETKTNKKGKEKMMAAYEHSEAVLLSDTVIHNYEVTEQIDHTSTCIVNTAMDTHIGTRNYQQDAVYVCDPLYKQGMAFGILCDGMGGMAEGERASSDVTVFMANRIATLTEGQDIPAFLERAALDANEMVLKSNTKTGQNSGTTLVSVIIRQRELNWLHVGDSRIYIVRNGELARLTKDHNFALELNEMVEVGQITRQQADTDPRKDALVSYIGAPVLEMVDVNRGSFALEYGDLVLLCSDGLTKVLNDNEILEVTVKLGNDVAEMARLLPKLAFDKALCGMDNTSVILMQYFGAAQ